jgi:hypothetical protein
LLVSALRHTGVENSAGRWLLEVLLDQMNSPTPPKNALSDVLWADLKTRLHAESISLVGRPWLFKPDPKNEGVERGWHKRKLANEDGWKEIRIAADWESQGYPDLDGWAWYRLSVEIPKQWKNRQVYLSVSVPQNT